MQDILKTCVLFLYSTQIVARKNSSGTEDYKESTSLLLKRNDPSDVNLKAFMDLNNCIEDNLVCDYGTVFKQNESKCFLVAFNPLIIT